VLLGRGGVAFPAGKKMDAVADDAPFLRFIVCNADEMDPGTFKDRVLIHADPHMLIEWMIITGYGILIDFFARESCGWCTPCREGTEAMVEILSRLSKVEEKPVLIEDIYLHPILFAGIDRFDMTDQSLSKVVDENYYMRPSGGKQNFRIGFLIGERALNLQVSEETPILTVKRFLHFTQAKNAIYSELYCRTDQFVFSQTIGGIAYE